jgi:hypothetical protein
MKKRHLANTLLKSTVAKVKILAKAMVAAKQTKTSAKVTMSAKAKVVALQTVTRSNSC